MNFRRASLLIALAAGLFALAATAPDSSQAQTRRMTCSDCHQLHKSPGGKLNKEDEFNLICASCHGLGGTALYVEAHMYPKLINAGWNTDSPYFQFKCNTCHTAHYGGQNKFYDGGLTHDHFDGGNNLEGTADGTNIMMVGKYLDGSGVVKLETPLGIFAAVSNSSGTAEIEAGVKSCSVGNSAVQVQLPPFSAGIGPPHTIMTGDRITIQGTNPSTYDGTFRVTETFAGTYEDWICYANPHDPGTYAGSDMVGQTISYPDNPNGWVFSAGWHNRPYVKKADWSGGTAELTLGGVYSLRVGEAITVSGVSEIVANTFNGQKSITAVSSTAVTGGVWSAGTATLTLDENHLYLPGDGIAVSNLTSGGPAEFNGSFTVSTVSGLDVSYALASDPGSYTRGGFVDQPLGFSQVAYAAADPGTTGVSGGVIEYGASVKAIAGATHSITSTTVTNAAYAGGGTREITLTLAGSHSVQVGETAVVSNINPTGYNGTHVVTAVAGNDITYPSSSNPGTYVSGGDVAYHGQLVFTLSDARAGATDGVNPASAGLLDGDIIRVYGIGDEPGYNGKWEVVGVTTSPNTVTVRCAPYFRDLAGVGLPACDLNSLQMNPSMGGGFVQSTGSMRNVVFDSRGTTSSDTGNLNHYRHSFTTTDDDDDGEMDGICELCHTQASNHLNDDLGNTHNNGKWCPSCHTHQAGFDKN